MIFISTLLPEPFSPTSPTSSPGPISRLAPRNTATVERRPGSPWRKPFFTSLTRRTASLCGPGFSGILIASLIPYGGIHPTARAIANNQG